MLEKFPRVPRYGLLPNTPVNNAELNLAEEYCSAVSAISASSALWTWPVFFAFWWYWQLCSCIHFFLNYSSFLCHFVLLFFDVFNDKAIFFPCTLFDCLQALKKLLLEHFECIVILAGVCQTFYLIKQIPAFRS